MTSVRRLTVLLRGTLAAGVLILLVLGVPTALVITVGNPIPEFTTINGTLTNAAILAVLACAAWVVWAQLVVCVVVEVIAEIRLVTGRSADWLSRVPGTFGGQQALARTLVQAVVAIGATTAAMASLAPSMATAEAATVDQLVAIQPDVIQPNVIVWAEATAPALATARKTAAVEVEVARGDSLWSIATEQLGSGERWHEIADLNHGHRMVDGTTFDAARTIKPGWKLLIPSAGREPGPGSVTTVRAGDSLWRIAESAYDDGTKWPRIYAANDSRIQDPNLIYPGQEFRIPALRSDETAVEDPHPPHPSQTEGRQQSDPPTTLPPPSSQVAPEVASAPTPTASAVPSLEPEATTEVAPDEQADATHGFGFDVDKATVTRALVSGGGFLAASLLALYAGRRRAQSRDRRAGRMTPPVAAHLRPEAKALLAVGSSASERIESLDASLRELVDLTEAAEVDVPDVVAMRIDHSTLDLHLRAPIPAAPPPWTTSRAGEVWSVSLSHQPSPTKRTSPYPAVVTVGDDERGGTWLIDLEAAGVVEIVGDQQAGEELARFMAAELALSPWAELDVVELVALAEDLVPLNPGLLFAVPRLDIHRLTKTARQVGEETGYAPGAVLRSRADQREQAWLPTLTVASIRDGDRETVTGEALEFLEEWERSAGRASAALVVATSVSVTEQATTLEFTHEGQLRTPWATVTPNRLTARESTLIGELFDDADVDDEVDIPVRTTTDGSMVHSNQAGALAKTVTVERSGTGDPDSILPLPDEAYIESAATTVEDLAELAPSAAERAAILALDPSLDTDLAAWVDPSDTRPKLQVLGPVDLRAVGEKTKEVDTRPAYFVELAAYLVCYPNGRTPDQVAADFGIQNNSLHTRMGQLRKWMGLNPATGDFRLPIAQRVRGKLLYQVFDVISDADLFRRLRSRGEARGPEGIEDFRLALELVVGRPYDQQRSRGYGWLMDTPDDHYLTAAIVDVAHVYATHCLAGSRPREAIWAAEKAITAAPSEDRPRLDLVRATHAMGRAVEAAALLDQSVFGRADDDRAPAEGSSRTDEVAGRIGDHADLE